MNHRTSVLPQRQSPITPLLEHAPSAAAFCGSAAIFHPLSAPAVLAQRPENEKADKNYSADGRAEKAIDGRYAARHAAYGNASMCKRHRFMDSEAFILKYPQTRLSSCTGEKTMAFINERIPEADVKKYGLEAIDEQHLVGRTSSRAWTIDRARDIYLRCVARGRDDESHISTWTFYWKSALIWFKWEIIDFKGARNAPCWTHLRLYDFKMPEALQSRREEIFRDLHDAFLAYKDGGIYATCTEYSMQLDIEA